LFVKKTKFLGHVHSILGRERGGPTDFVENDAAAI
jgi:hypothetical protein